MKKHIVLIQSLMLLPIISTPSLFGMEHPDYGYSLSNEENQDPGIYDERGLLVGFAINKEFLQGEKYYGDDATDLDLYVVCNAKEDTLIIETKERSFKDIHELLLNNTITLKTTKKAPVTKNPSKEYWEEKHEQFQRLLHELTSDVPLLKKVSAIIETTQATPVEDWVQPYQNWIEKYQDTVNAIATNKVALKQNPIITTPIEHQEKLRKALDLLPNNPMAELKAPKIYPTNQWVLGESIIMTSTPSKKGLDSLPYKHQYGYQYGTHKPHHIIEYLFTDMATDNTEKRKFKFNVDGIETDNTTMAHYLFDVKNETHIELLEQTFNYYISQNDAQAIMNLLEKCQCTAGELQINPRVAGKIHNYLTSIIKNEETDAQLILKKKNDAFVQKSNALIVALQEELILHNKLLQEEYDKHTKESNDTFAKKAEYIRQLEENALAAHVLSSDIKLAKNECSHAIDHLRSQITKVKVYMTQQDVKTVCSNDRLLKKIELSEPMAALQQNGQFLLDHISAINSATQGVKLLK